MQPTIAGLPADHYPPESTKFRSSIVFVHGLWSASWCWQTWAMHFCNLGWDCFATNLRGRFGQNPIAELQRLSFDDCIQDLSAVLKDFAFPPVVVGLNLGASLALKAAQQTSASALVLASPAPLRSDTARSRALRLLRLKYLPLIYLRRPFRIDQKDFSKGFLTGLAEDVQQEIYRQTVPESSLLVREFFSPSSTISRNSLTCPILTLAGGDDPMMSAAARRDDAERLGADFKEYLAQGHWLIKRDSQSIVRDIHRWLVQKLGDQIVLAEIG